MNSKKSQIEMTTEEAAKNLSCLRRTSSWRTVRPNVRIPPPEMKSNIRPRPDLASGIDQGTSDLV